MDKQIIGWISLLIVVIATSAIGSIRMLGIDPAIAGVLALGLLMVAGFVIREVRKQHTDNNIL